MEKYNNREVNEVSNYYVEHLRNIREKIFLDYIHEIEDMIAQRFEIKFDAIVLSISGSVFPVYKGEICRFNHMHVRDNNLKIASYAEGDYFDYKDRTLENAVQVYNETLKLKWVPVKIYSLLDTYIIAYHEFKKVE